MRIAYTHGPLGLDGNYEVISSNCAFLVCYDAINDEMVVEFETGKNPYNLGLVLSAVEDTIKKISETEVGKKADDWKWRIRIDAEKEETGNE